MNGDKISLERIAEQLEIIQDFISLKFGSDFQEFCIVRGLPQMAKGLSRKFEPDTFSYQLTPRKLLKPVKPGRQEDATPAKRQKIVADKSDDDDSDEDSDGSELFAINPLKVEWEDVVDEDGHEDVVFYDIPPGARDNQPDDGLPSDDDADPDYVDGEETSKRSGEKDKPKGPGRWPEKGPLEVQPLIQITESSQKKQKLVINGYGYLFQRMGFPSKRIWQCDRQRNKKCKSRIHTTDSLTNPELIAELGVHNHEPCTVIKPPKPEKKRKSLTPRPKRDKDSQTIKYYQHSTNQNTNETTEMSTIGGDLDLLTNYLLPTENQT